MTREEAIEIVKTQYPHDHVMKTALGLLIPELRESEDERIRKALIYEVSEWSEDTGFGKECIPRNKVLSWLEKQKEQKPAKDKYQQELEATDRWQEGYEAGYNAASRPAWSKEDKKMLQGIIERGQAQIQWCDTGLRPEQVTWLKSLPERFNLTPKQEWSEADEDRIRQIERIAQQAGCTQKLQEEIHDWLKSLRPPKDCSGCSKHLDGYISGRSDAENKLPEMYGILLMPDGELRMIPRWKPTEEQMDALNKARRFIPYNCDILESLYEQLKKL